MPFISRLVSSMLHKVQEWEVENQTIFKAGEPVEFMDSSGVVMRGTICGEASGNGNAGMAQVRLDFWQPESGASPAGCDGTHALGGREEQFSTRQLGRPARSKRLPVRVVAPSGYQLEERVRPKAVHPTSGEAFGPGFGIQEVYRVVEGEPSTNRAASVVELGKDIEEEFLDYEEEAEELDRGHRRACRRGAQWMFYTKRQRRRSRAIVGLEEIARCLLLEMYLEVRNIEHSQTGLDVQMLGLTV
ncbi:hypothetical protein NDU88_006311 [Pleurodeles waltl]|uniref:Uncharacterized protein n=1 Tax=Pleurodeles waltl TaxID=8319 RepID=A0AAV7N018_PLEWA|nr:hypothetical protein NDU88_006311 [Pleurodeles waltl]